ncbi:hypothetical protein PHYPSEUDO_004289 [Phytophthora pseudosyringae]|uniref:Dynein heavy chain n=1 Tax=Phytophthora pseudosyringae TaxID=221518 RepID=A0A8T1VRG1_9STRA|nr:hypothetical protein PHYPSEUDO_004289 [Phytophthora pseudosyringae]
MQDHVRFGAPPKLRPRTAGSSRSSLPPNGYNTASSTSTSASAPERLASAANAPRAESPSLLVRSYVASLLYTFVRGQLFSYVPFVAPLLQLRQRLQSPRPGSAAPRQTPRAPGAAASSTDKGVFMKPPMRPKSATAASRVSRHRMQLVHDPAVAMGSNQHEDDRQVARQRDPESVLTSAKEEEGRPGAAMSTAQPSASFVTRPFSASAAPPSTYRSSVLNASNQPVEASSTFATARGASGVKRPHSAAASSRYQPFRARETSSSSLTSCFSVVSHTAKAPRSMSALSTRSGHSRGDRLLASTREHLANTFVYAVPRHVLEHGLPLILPFSPPPPQETLFGGGSVNQMQDANWDYYTISRSGYTFHVKNDNFQSTFLSLGSWETQKAQFTKLRRLTTFSAFRYRKVFLGWRQWVRSSKREAARENLISACYFSFPALFNGMQEVRTELARLSKLQLMWNFNGETVSLEDFTAANAKFVKSRTKELQQTTTRIQKILAGVCRVFLDDTAPLHAGFPGHEFALSVRKSSNFHILRSYVQCEQGLASAHQQLMQHKHFRSTRLTTVDAAEARAALLMSSIAEHGKESEKSAPRPATEPNELEDIRWTMASIKRRKCKQLTTFMTLVDFLLLDTFAHVIKQSLDLLSSFVLRGANAGTVVKLTDRDNLAMAMHQTLRRNAIQSAGEGSGDISGQPRQVQRAPLTKQQIKAFLHAAWEGKFRASSSTAEDEASALSGLSVMTMENRLEALLFYALSKHSDANAEAFSVDDLFSVAESTLTQLLVLPHFTSANMSIYTRPQNEDPSTSNAMTAGDTGNPLEQEVLAIPCLSRQPLFSLGLATSVISEKRGRRSYQICLKPELAELIRTLQSIIVGFTGAFRKVPPLLSSPELRSVLEFADDIRALNLHSSFTTDTASGAHPAATISRRNVRFPSERDTDANGDNVSGDEDSNEHFRCPADRLLERMDEDMHYLSVRDDVQDLTRSALHGAAELANCYSKVLELRQHNESVNFDVKARQFRRNEYTLDQIKQDAAHFTDQLAALKTLRLSADVEFLHFDMRQLQAELLPSPARCLDAMRELLPRLAREKCDQFLSYIHISSTKIEKPVVQDLDAFAKYLVNLREVYDEILDKELELMFLHDFFGVLAKLKFDTPLEIAKVFELCGPEFQALKAHVQEVYASRDADIQNYTPLLTENLATLARQISWLQSAASDQEVVAQSCTCQDARENAVKLYREAIVMQQEASRLIRIQQVFEEAANDLLPPSKTFENLNALSAELKLKSELWQAVCEADEHLSECSTDTIQSVDLDKMGTVASHVDSVVETIRQCTSRVVGNFELDRLEKLQATLHGLAPVIRDLRNPHLAERHWSKLEHKMQCSLAPISADVDEETQVDELAPALEATDGTEPLVSSRLDLQVKQLLEVDAVAHGTTIRHVSEEASAEVAIAGSFMSVVRTWEAQEIPVEPKKDRDGRDVNCIGDCIELTSLIEESQVLLRVMDLSTYSLVVHERLPKMLHDLEHTKESLELLQMCQRKWDYTQRLVSIDFARTFPEQAKQLQKHDTAWRSLTLGLFNRSLCLPFGVSPDNRQALYGILEGFEAAVKTLADHLEIKRQVFPAFFQLSDLELATLLSKCRDVSCTPSFLFQCFDNVGQIVFGTRDAFQDILQITSRAYGEAETIPMGKNLKARGPVEQWLAAVEKRLAEQLRRSTKQVIEVLSRHDTSGLSSISHFPIQAILLADRVVRCAIIENGLRDVTTMGNDKFDRIASQLAGYSSSVKDQVLPLRHQRSTGLRSEAAVLSPREIALCACLSLQEIHFRDAFSSHVSSQQPGSFGLAIDWEYQLKYRMDDATTVGHECHVEMNTLNIPYGFNYMSPCQDSVVTPSSLRSLLSLFACVRHAQGCILTGPSESGKRTLSMQVSSMLGRRSFTAAVTSYTHATRLLIGALHAGGTFCASLQFAATLEASAALIKTLATTLASIEHAVLTKNLIVGLDRSPVTFIHGTAMLVILPSSPQLSLADAEEIKIWTEPLSRFAVVQWDWAYIFEALLVSKGFAGSRELAKKLLFLWQDARSSFDVARGKTPTAHGTPFSYSALKTIVADAALKLDPLAAMSESNNTLEDHQQMLIHRAVLQYFHVRIDAEQLEGLEAVLKYAFPHTSNSEICAEWKSAEQQNTASTCPGLQEYIALALRELNFVPRKILVDAASSLADALTFNMSAVLVGPSGVGKSASYQVLARALELYLQRLDQGEATASQEPSKPQQPGSVQARPSLATLYKRSNSFLTPKADKKSVGSVAIHVVLPMALTVAQLYGGVSLDDHGRIPSIMGQLIREAQEIYVPNYSKPSDANPTKSLLDLHNQVWIVFDDALDIRWMEGLLTVLAKPKRVASPLLPFEDGEFMTLPSNLRIVFEVLQLRDATPAFLHASAILPVSADKPAEPSATTKTGYRRTKAVDVYLGMPVATAFLHRYVELLRGQALLQNQESPSWSPADTCNVVERWLLKSSFLAELGAVLDDNSEIVAFSQLQRVANLTSMLQSLLSTACALPDPNRTADKTATTLVAFAEDLPRGQIRVEMALVYSFLWGFAACTGDQTTLQRQLSDMVRREFEHVEPAWTGCGMDVNLYETLLDLQGLRFVPVVGASGQPSIPPQVTNSGGISTLFVPTTSSLMVHAAIQEALRSGRGVLLLGGASSRRTTLARSFLGQLDAVRSIVAAGSVSNMIRARYAGDDDSDKARNLVSSKTNEAATLASVKRFRLRQISLVTCMALRLQKDTGDGSGSLEASRSTSVASIATSSGNQTVADVLEAEEGVPLAIVPSMDPSKTAMVRQFDRGDVIPFFFAMPHSNSPDNQSADVSSELANCLERMLQRERTDVFEPPPGKTALLILDDLHLALPDEAAAGRTTQLPLYPSVYAYLRYVQERRMVYRGTSCLPTSVENLMLFASMSVEKFPDDAATQEHDESLCKLSSKFFPVLAPSCGLEELHHIFGQALQTHWGSNSTKTSGTGGGALATTVRCALPLIVAATTVLWDRLRSTCKFCLQDLARVYEGLAGAGPSLLPDVETLLRLWTHECSRTLREPSMGTWSQRQDDEVAGEITRMRASVSQVAQRRASARASHFSLGPEAGLNFLAGSKRQSVQAGQPASDLSASPATLLALFAARSSSMTASTGKQSVAYSRLSLQYASFQEQRHHASMVGGLWAYVPASIYYGGAPTLLPSTQGEGNSGAASGTSEPPQRVHRRSSASFLRQRSLETGAPDCDALYRALGRHGRWIYAEISFEDDSEALSTAAVQAYYRDLRIFSSTVMASGARRANKALSLPRDVASVPFELAQVIARIDRVLARPAARLILLDNSSSAADTLLCFANFSRTPELQASGAILTLAGLVEDPNTATNAHLCLTRRWKRLLLELYERVGVAGQDATLVVKRLDLLPPTIVNQLQALMTTGEVSGMLSLEEQVHLATRVCDERLLDMKMKHAVQVAQIRSEAEATRDQALTILHQQQRDAPTTPLLEAFQLVEMRYQRELRSKLARVDLRWQQDSDDLRREREVESESVAATVMALTRPLGVTSGKWASAVARVCSKLRVVLQIDKKDEIRVRSSSPGLFATCDVVSVPQLDRDSLRTLVYGHFHAQVQQLVRDHIGTNSNSERELLDFLHQVQRSLWTLVCMATDMHLAVVDAFSTVLDDKEECPPIARALAMASMFAKLIVGGYKREEAARAKASWFLDLSNRLDRDLGALRSSDAILSEQLTTIDQQLTTHNAKLVEQKEDAERIRTIMQRFQIAADEQIQVTNEAQEVAQRELREPMACLEEANRALLLIDRRHIVEIKSFVNPPPLVHLVLGAVCVLFQLEPSWESARRLLLGDANVVQTLLQFNKDAVSAATLAKLHAEYLRDERFCREEVERQSVAAASMVGWVRAIHQYASARHQVQPTLDKLEKAQSRLNLIVQEFQVSKQRVVEADEAWQATQAAIDAATTRKEALAGEISSLEARCNSGGQAMEALQEDRRRQQLAASASSTRRGFSLTSWNALLSAGALVYACELHPSSRRERVFRAWEAAYCFYGGLTPGCPPTSTCCSFVPSISVVLNANAISDEQTQDVREFETPLSALFAGDYPDDGNTGAEEMMKLVTAVAVLGFSQRRLWDVSLLSVVAATSALPVVLITRYSSDLEELLAACARRVWHWTQLRMAYARAPDFDDEFRLAARLGHQLLVLDVEPLDSEPHHDSEHHICLQAALSWTTSAIDGAEHLILPRKSSEADAESADSKVSTDDPTNMDSIALHPNFRLILTSHASRAAFGEVLGMIPTLDAQLHPSDMADVMLDKIWSSSTMRSSDRPDSAGGLQLKEALREHGRLAQQYEASYAQLTKLLEAAAVTSQFPLAQTQSLRDRLATLQEARRVLRDNRRQIQEQLRLVKRKYIALARTGATVFNSFNVTMINSGPNPSPPLTLQVFLPILLDAVAPASATSTSTAGVSPAPTAPLLNDTTRRASSTRLGSLVRRATSTSFVLAAASRGAVGVPSDVLTTLLTRIAPLVPPTSPNGDWYRFLLQVLAALEKMHPTAQKVTQVDEDENSQEEATNAGDTTPRSVSTILLQAKLQIGSKHGALSPLVTTEACKELAISYAWPDLQRRVVSMIFNGCKTERTRNDGNRIDDMVRFALPGVSSRSDRLRASLVLFPELVHHVCDRVLAGYGVPPNVHRRGSVATITENEEGAVEEGFWLRTIRGLPEQTAVLLLTRHEFHSFAFARRVFFDGINGCSALQIRVLQELGGRTFRVAKEDDEAAVTTTARIAQDEPVSLTQLYVLPRCVHPSEDQHDEDVRQLLLMADNFKRVVQMEKTQLEALEAAPLAVICMNAAVPEYWEALIQILHRSCSRTTSATFQRHGSIMASEGPASAVVMSAPTANGGTAHRFSQSMMHRRSAIDLVTPTYPRLVAAVDNLSALPVHLRANVVCFRDENEDEAGEVDGGQAPSLSKCLQSTILRLTLHPCVQTLSGLTEPGEGDTDAARAPSPDLWVAVSGLVLFHSTLVFRSQVLRSAYPGALPSPHHPVGTGAVFHYSDDVFLTAINQCIAVLAEKQHHHNDNQQRRRTGRSSAYTDVFERGMYQQIVLSSYARLAAGHQEVAFLKKLFIECLQLVGWNEPSTRGPGLQPRMPSIREPSRQMTIRDQLRGPRGSLAQLSSGLLIKHPSSTQATPSSLPLGFLAFPSEGLRQADLSLSQWLELVWAYSSSIDQQMNGKLHALLLGHQPNSKNRRGSLEDSSRDLVVASGGIELASCPPPKWMWAFGWTGDHHAAPLGDAAELVAIVPLQVAVDVVLAIVAEALPPRFTLESWSHVEAENNHVDEEEQATWVQPELLDVEPALKFMVAVYNLHVEACSASLETILENLLEHETHVDAHHAPSNSLVEGAEHEESDQDDDSGDESDNEPANAAGNSLRLVDIEDSYVRRQVVSILRNEIPPGLLGQRSSCTPPTTSSWSLHDLLQHYQDWFSFFKQLRPHDNSNPPRWWLPGLLASNLPIRHVLELARTRHSRQPTTLVQFTLQLPPVEQDTDHEGLHRPLPENTIAIFDGVVLLGATWNEEGRYLDRVDALQPHHRVQLVCSLAGDDQQLPASHRVPLLAPHDGSLLLECALAVHPSGVSPLATPFLAPVGSRYR